MQILGSTGRLRLAPPGRHPRGGFGFFCVDQVVPIGVEFFERIARTEKLAPAQVTIVVAVPALEPDWPDGASSDCFRRHGGHLRVHALRCAEWIEHAPFEFDPKTP